MTDAAFYPVALVVLLHQNVVRLTEGAVFKVTRQQAGLSKVLGDAISDLEAEWRLNKNCRSEIPPQGSLKF